jgi:hypothetical protein
MTRRGRSARSSSLAGGPQTAAALWIGGVLVGGLAIFGLVRAISPSPLSQPIPQTPPQPPVGSNLQPAVAIGPYGLAAPGANA